MLRTLTCLSLLGILVGCAGDRAFYEGLRQDNARRQYEPGRDISREPAPPSFDDYEKERQRLREDKSR